jgi:hypothetical protein
MGDTKKEIYPRFNIESITKRCEEDIKKFKEDNGNVEEDIPMVEADSPNVETNNLNVEAVNPNVETDNLNVEAVNPNVTYINEFQLHTIGLTDFVTLQNAIAPLIQAINNLTGNDTYVDYVSTSNDNDIKYNLWIARTKLFYQILIFVTLILSDEPLYNKVFTPENKKYHNYDYRRDVAPQLNNFVMGIFGSMTPTSDIDIGVKYVGTYNTIIQGEASVLGGTGPVTVQGTVEYIPPPLESPALAYVVSTFESLFCIFTGKLNGSLDYDIEMYADMFVLNNTDKETNGQHPEVFYLDSSKFTEKEFTDMLPCAHLSIARNVLLHDKNIGSITLEDIVSVFKADIVNMSISNTDTELSKFSDFLSKLNGTTIFPAESIGDSFITTHVSFNNAFQKMKTFLTTMEYQEQREAYYTKVEIAETKMFSYTPEELKQLDNTKICELMILMGQALAYRMESYTCSPTIVHVVRTMQLAKKKEEPNTPEPNTPEPNAKYKTTSVGVICGTETIPIKPECVIGKYGYALSILEQIGCLYRFYKHYCIPKGEAPAGSTSTPLPEKCVKKQLKYMERYVDAYTKMKEYIPKGGGKRKYRPRILKTRRLATKRTRRLASKKTRCKLATKRTRRVASKRTRRQA